MEMENKRMVQTNPMPAIQPVEDIVICNGDTGNFRVPLHPKPLSKNKQNRFPRSSPRVALIDRIKRKPKITVEIPIVKEDKFEFLKHLLPELYSKLTLLQEAMDQPIDDFSETEEKPKMKRPRLTLLGSMKKPYVKKSPRLTGFIYWTETIYAARKTPWDPVHLELQIRIHTARPRTKQEEEETRKNLDKSFARRNSMGFERLKVKNQPIVKWNKYYKTSYSII